MVKNWKTKEDKFIDNFKIFDIHKVIRTTEDFSKEGQFVYLDSLPWVNIIPLTKDNHIILIEQFRHGTCEVTIEIPGGIVEKDESPDKAGTRECTEETGYFSKEKPEFLGMMKPNPAFLNNICYSYLWRNVEKRYEQNLDNNEEINIIKASFADVLDFIRQGKINHSLVLNAFFFYYLKYNTL